MIAVFDIGGTTVKYGLFQDCQLSQVSHFKTPDSFEMLKQSMKNALDSFACVVEGIAISAPGAVNEEKRRIDGISAVDYLHKRPIFDELEAYFKLPVTIENDANCAGICEMQIGAGKKFKQAVFIVLGTGVGGGVFVNRRLYKGAHLFGGEFGLMKGRKNTILSQNGTAVKAALKYSEQIGYTIDGRELFSRSAEADPLAQNLLNEMYEDIAEMLYNVQVSLDPEVIILGGGISAREEISKGISQSLKEKLQKEGISEIMPQVLCCYYKNNANLLGAGLNYLDHLKTQ